MINYPPKPWEDGQQFKTTDSTGEEIVGTYDASKNAWSFTRLQEGVPGGGIGFVTTEDVQTTASIPTAPDDWTGLDLTQDVLDLKTQKQVNWFLSEAIVNNKEELESLLWIGSNPPDERDTSYIFWWDTLNLELLVKHNGQWFPVAIPPRQLETLRQELDQLYTYTSNNRIANFDTRQEFEIAIADLNEEREALKAEYDGKLATLEEELEQLAPSLERGSWTFTLNHPPGPGEYTMISAFLDEDDQEALCNETYAECMAAAGGDALAQQACNREWDTCRNAIDGSRVITTDDWTQCDELVFNDVDMNGTTHGWGGIDSDHYIDVFNMNDENYMVGDIATHGGGIFSFDLVSSRGVASGPATIKIFKSEGTIDFDQYVRKSGDSMKGRLSIYPTGNNPAFYVYPSDDVSENTYCIRQFGQPYVDEEGNTKRDTVFYTTSEGYPSIHSSHTPTSNRHLTPKKYVDDAVRTNVDRLYYPARFSWRVTNESEDGPAEGYMHWNGTSVANSTECRINLKSYDSRLDLFEIDDSKVVYSGPTNSSMMITGFYIGSDSDNKWKWKGTANITKITAYKRNNKHYLKCDLGSYKTSNYTFADGGRYYFTIPGLF